MRGTRENPAHLAAVRNWPCATCGAATEEPCRNIKGAVAWPPHKARLSVQTTETKR